MNADFSDKVVLVTGASRGIGREIARQFALRGARLVVHFHQNRRAAEQTLADVPDNSHLLLQADLSDADGAADLAQKALHAVGKIDVLVNNAGVYEFHPRRHELF